MRPPYGDQRAVVPFYMENAAEKRANPGSTFHLLPTAAVLVHTCGSNFMPSTTRNRGTTQQQQQPPPTREAQSPI
jgi:hypothetical protein